VLNGEFKELSKIKGIDRIEDRSSDGMNRMRIHFNNNYQLSVVTGRFSYGGDEGLFEIAVFNKDGGMDGGLLDDVDQGDDVLGYLSVDRVNYYIEKIAALA